MDEQEKKTSQNITVLYNTGEDVEFQDVLGYQASGSVVAITLDEGKTLVIPYASIREFMIEAKE